MHFPFFSFLCFFSSFSVFLELLVILYHGALRWRRGSAGSPWRFYLQAVTERRAGVGAVRQVDGPVVARGDVRARVPSAECREACEAVADMRAILRVHVHGRSRRVRVVLEITHAPDVCAW